MNNESKKELRWKQNKKYFLKITLSGAAADNIYIIGAARCNKKFGLSANPIISFILV